MNDNSALLFDIDKIYTIVHKVECANFFYDCEERCWDGFVIITSGDAVIFCEHEVEHILKKGNIVFLRRGEKYTIKSDAPCSYYTSAFDFSKNSDATMSFLQKFSYCNALQLKEIDSIMRSWQSKSADSYMFCKIQLLKFYYDILCSSKSIKANEKGDCVATALKFIHENYKRNYKSSEISAVCSLSESRLRVLFKKEIGMTMGEYRDLLRIKIAKELLSSGVFSIKETAYELGFCDVYYFTKFFTAFTNISPGEFKKTYSKNG